MRSLFSTFVENSMTTDLVSYQSLCISICHLHNVLHYYVYWSFAALVLELFNEVITVLLPKI